MKFAISKVCCATFIISCNQGQFVSNASAQNGLPRPDYAAKVIDLPEQTQKRFMQSVDGFLRDQKIDPNRSANSLGWDCLAANALLDAGETRARDKVQSIARRMATIVIRSGANGSPIGWAATIQDKRCDNGGYDAFQDGTCNPKDTTYGIETGLGIACLAKASIALGNASLLNMHQAFVIGKDICCQNHYVLDVSTMQLAITRTIRANIKNMNVFMALGAATLGGARTIKSHKNRKASHAIGIS